MTDGEKLVLVLIALQPHARGRAKALEQLRAVDPSTASIVEHALNPPVGRPPTFGTEAAIVRDATRDAKMLRHGFTAAHKRRGQKAPRWFTLEYAASLACAEKIESWLRLRGVRKNATGEYDPDKIATAVHELSGRVATELRGRGIAKARRKGKR